MQIKELDVVLLNDGRKATILDAYDSDKCYLVEIADKNGRTLDTPFVALSDISEVLWSA